MDNLTKIILIVVVAFLLLGCSCSCKGIEGFEKKNKSGKKKSGGRKKGSGGMNRGSGGMNRGSGGRKKGSGGMNRGSGGMNRGGMKRATRPRSTVKKPMKKELVKCSGYFPTDIQGRNKYDGECNSICDSKYILTDSQANCGFNNCCLIDKEMVKEAEKLKVIVKPVIQKEQVVREKTPVEVESVVQKEQVVEAEQIVDQMPQKDTCQSEPDQRFRCGPMKPKADYENINCQGVKCRREECCDKVISKCDDSFYINSCPSGSKLINKGKQCSGDQCTTQECCKNIVKCNAPEYNCPDGWENKGDVNCAGDSCTQSECCTEIQTCKNITCPDTYYIKEEDKNKKCVNNNCYSLKSQMICCTKDRSKRKSVSDDVQVSSASTSTDISDSRPAPVTNPVSNVKCGSWECTGNWLDNNSRKNSNCPGGTCTNEYCCIDSTPQSNEEIGITEAQGEVRNFSSGKDNTYCSGSKWQEDKGASISKDRMDGTVTQRATECKRMCNLNKKCKGIVFTDDQSCISCTSPDLTWVNDVNYLGIGYAKVTDPV